MNGARTVRVAIAMGTLLALTACSSSDTAETLVPVAAPQPVAVNVAQPLPPTSSPAALNALAPATEAGAATTTALSTSSLAIAPVTGAPRGAVLPMSRAMAARGREIGIDFARGGAATHELRGYFSINDDGAETRVVYIWDVLTPPGRRVHRIRGQEVLPPAPGGDPWRSVPVATMERIGASTVDRYARWRSG